jgi:hypothetical protein
MERTTTGSIRGRLRAALRAAHPDDVEGLDDVAGHVCAAGATSSAGSSVDSEAFVCAGCLNELPISERSRVALGRCRACA